MHPLGVAQRVGPEEICRVMSYSRLTFYFFMSQEHHDDRADTHNVLLNRLQEAKGQLADLRCRLDRAGPKRDTLHDEGTRLRQEIELLDAEKKDCEAAHQTELEQLYTAHYDALVQVEASHRDALSQKETSHTAELERLDQAHRTKKAL